MTNFSQSEIHAVEDFRSLQAPPHSIESESSVLGSLLLDNRSLDIIGGMISESDFYRYEHQIIFKSVSRLIGAGKPADVVTVFEDLQSCSKAGDAGGLQYLNQLAQFVHNASNVRRYAEIVRERAVLRKLAQAGSDIISSSMNTDGMPVAQVLDLAEQRILSIAEEGGRSKDGFEDMKTLMGALLDRVQELADNPRQLTGVSTGFVDLDRMTSGLQAGDLVVIAARPSMGKTAFAINIAEHVALKEGQPVAVFSMEMGSNQLMNRIVSSTGRVNHTHLQNGKLTHDEWSRLTDVAQQIAESEIHIDDSAGLTIPALRAGARRLAKRVGKLGLIVVDYLQLMQGSGSDGDNRASELGEMSRGLKMLAKELQCPVIAISQLNRSVETRIDKRPLMSDLRESGAIEQDADVIMFLYRDDYYTKENSKEPGVAELIISKQRNGPTGTVRLVFLNQLTRFESLAA